MRLFLIAPVIALAAGPSSAAESHQPRSKPLPVLQSGKACPTPLKHRKGAGEGKFQRLGELPPADAYAAVYRTVNGCSEPIVLTRGPRR